MLDRDDIRSIPIVGELVIVPTLLVDVLLNGGEIVVILLDVLLANVPLIYSLVGTLTAAGTSLPLIDAAALGTIRDVLIVTVAVLYAHRLLTKILGRDSTS